MIKLIAITGVAALAGAWIGASGVLCLNGQCAMTGTWYGGAVTGALLGYLLLGVRSSPQK